MTSKRSVALLIIGLVALVTAACGGGAIDESELEASVAEQLAAETGQPEPNIDCPGDLEAEVGATTECDLSVDGDDAVYPVAVEVTSVEGDQVNYKVEVGDAPSSGGDTGADSSEPTDGDGTPAGDPETPADEPDVQDEGDTGPPAAETDPATDGTE